MTEHLNFFHVDWQQSIDDSIFPLIVDGSEVPAEKIDTWIRARQETIADQLSRNGAVMFRGFPVDTIDDFDLFIRAFDMPNFQYKDSFSNAVRVNKTERVFTANEAPPDVEIFMHHEMAQTPVYPSRLFFYCNKAAEQAGATPICRSDLLWTRIQSEFPEFAKAAETHGLLYTNVMPATDDPESGQGRSLGSTFFAEDRAEAERRMTELGYSWTWNEDESLAATTPMLPAVRELEDGSKVFFNQLIAAFKGNGTHLSLRRPVSPMSCYDNSHPGQRFSRAKRSSHRLSECHCL